MAKIAYPIANTLTFVFTLFANYWTNTGKYNGKTVGDISNQYDTLFTPAGYVFAIWGVIYLLLFLFICYQWYCYITGRMYEGAKIGFLFAFTNILNGIWVFAWLEEFMGASLLIMFGLLFTLIIMIEKLKGGAFLVSIKFNVFVIWPIAIYLGWIILASVANTAALFVKLNLNLPFSASFWTISLIFIATAIYVFLVWSRRLNASALVGIWGLVGIAVKQWVAASLISYIALSAVGLLAIVICIDVVRYYKVSSTL